MVRPAAEGHVHHARAGVRRPDDAVDDVGHVGGVALRRARDGERDLDRQQRRVEAGARDPAAVVRRGAREAGHVRPVEVVVVGERVGLRDLRVGRADVRRLVRRRRTGARRCRRPRPCPPARGGAVSISLSSTAIRVAALPRPRSQAVKKRGSCHCQSVLAPPMVPGEAVYGSLGTICVSNPSPRRCQSSRNTRGSSSSSSRAVATSPPGTANSAQPICGKARARVTPASRATSRASAPAGSLASTEGAPPRAAPPPGRRRAGRREGGDPPHPAYSPTPWTS